MPQKRCSLTSDIDWTYDFERRMTTAERYEPCHDLHISTIIERTEPGAATSRNDDCFFRRLILVARDWKAKLIALHSSTTIWSLD